MIYLHTLGDNLIKVGENEIRPTAPLLFAALLYLGMERGRRVPRTALQEMLFPESDERSGAHSLRQLLYKLRRLGAPIEVDATSVVVKADAVRDETELDMDSSSCFAERARACALGLLPNYTPRISVGYAEWLDEKRSAVAARIRKRLIAAMSSSRELIDWQAVERFAQLILQIDPFNEEATYALAEATAATTSKATALSMLQRYAEETQRTELALPSSMLRRRISENLRDVKWSGNRAPFLGREHEVSVVRDRMLAAKTGDASAVLVIGEVGLGKTRLVEEMATLAALDGMQVQFVRCQPHHVSRPLGVFIELVPSLLGLPGALGVTPQSFKELNVLTSRPDSESASVGDARDASTRSLVVLSALRDLLDAVTTNTSVVVIVEDAQWADQESLRELQIAADRGRRLLILVTARPTKELVSTFTSPRFSTVRLGPLSHEVMERIAAHILIGQKSDTYDVSSWCVLTASGNPLFLQTLCSHYASTGIPYAVPANLRDAISTRIAQLSDPCRRLLQLCALLGKHSSLESIRTLAECSDWTLIDSVQSLEDAGFLQVCGQEVRVAHDLLKEAALATLSPIAQRLFHAHVARYLEARYDDQHDASALWDCAEHWAASGESRKAVEFLTRCATHAGEIGQVSQAAVLLDRAASFAQSDEERRSIVRAQMLANKSMGRWATVHELAGKYATITTIASEDHSDVELLSIEAGWMICFTAGESTKRLLNCVSSRSTLTHRCEAALLLMRIAHERGDVQLAHSTFALIEHALPETFDYSVRILPLVYHTSFGDRTLALDLARRLRQDLSQYPVVTRLRAAMNVATAFGFLGADRECVDVLSEYYAAATAAGLKEWACDFASSACWKCVEQEMLEEAEEWYRIASRDLVSVSGNGVHRKLTACACELAIHKGDFDRANRLLAELRAFSSSESVRVAAYILSFETRLEQADPHARSSDAVMNELIRLHEASRGLVGADFLTLTLGEALRRRGRAHEARVLIDSYVSTYRRERSAPSAALLTLRAAIDQPATL